MSGVNKVILVGRLGKDPDVKYTQSGDAVVNFSLATSETWKDKDSGEKQEKTEWHRCVAWRRLAEICGEYLHKGSQIYIEGKLQTRSWEDQDGNKRWTTEIVAAQMTTVILYDRFIGLVRNIFFHCVIASRKSKRLVSC